MRILSIDGGGFRGLLPALVLAAFEARTGRSVAKCFDLIAGTSTGGIIALALAAGIPAQKIVEFYMEKGPGIFSRSLAKRITSMGGLADELYDAGALEIALFELFGERKLSSAEVKALVVAYDIQGRGAVLLRTWNAEDCLMAAAARATSAAPTYFEPYAVKTATGLVFPCIDGGVVANNPSLYAVVEALRLRGWRRIDLVSLGTGRNEKPILIEDAKDYGAPQWLPHILDIMFSGGAEVVHEQCRAMLLDRPNADYVRLQADLPYPVAMDATDADTVAVLKMCAGRLAESDAATRAFKMVGAA